MHWKKILIFKEISLCSYLKKLFLWINENFFENTISYFFKVQYILFKEIKEIFIDPKK